MSKSILKNNSKAENEVIKKYKRSHAESGRLEGGYEVSPHGPHRPSVAGGVVWAALCINAERSV